MQWNAALAASSKKLNKDQRGRNTKYIAIWINSFALFFLNIKLPICCWKNVNMKWIKGLESWNCGSPQNLLPVACFTLSCRFRCLRTFWDIILANNMWDSTTIKQNKDVTSFLMQYNHHNHRANGEYSIYIKFLEEYLRNLHWASSQPSLHCICSTEKSTKFAYCSYTHFPYLW